MALLPYIVTSSFTDSLNFCRVKQGKRFSEFLQKYTDSGTETTHLPGYHILVFKYVKNLV